MKILAAILAASALCASAPAKAEILASATRIGNFFSTMGNIDVAVPLNGAFNSIKFTTSAVNQLVRITYNAECSVIGTLATFVAVKIKVDGVEADPAAGNAFGLCTATSTYSNYVGASRQSLFRVPHTGQHSVTVTAYGANTTYWSLGDSSIVVDR